MCPSCAMLAVLRGGSLVQVSPPEQLRRMSTSLTAVLPIAEEPRHSVALASAQVV